MSPVVGIPGEIDTETYEPKDVHLEAVHVTERHDPDPHDKDVEKVNLPGTFDLYVVIDGGRILLDKLSGSAVLEAIQAAKDAKASK